MRWRGASITGDSSIRSPSIETVLKGLHANTNIPKVIGAARGYELTGDNPYREIADYFWHEVTSQRTYCTGGTSLIGRAPASLSK